MVFSTWTLLFILKYHGIGVTSENSIYLTKEDCQKAGALLKNNVYKNDPSFSVYALCYESMRLDIK
jgi:ABC-type Fe2+-enterobactin transport system substrate-binding protein